MVATVKLNSGRYTYWGSQIQAKPPSVHYDEIMADDKGVGKWTAKIVSKTELES